MYLCFHGYKCTTMQYQERVVMNLYIHFIEKIIYIISILFYFIYHYDSVYSILLCIRTSNFVCQVDMIDANHLGQNIENRNSIFSPTSVFLCG